jgi:peptide/nickel transport system permease protein
MLDVLGDDYIRTARSKGMPERRVITRHALRSALTPALTQLGIDLGTLLGGAIITENVFQWRGMGTLFLNALNNHGRGGTDVNVMLGWLLVTATIVIAFNLVADILYGFLDPRIRHA